MKHIRLYLITLFIACSMFMVCPFAYADSLSTNQQQVVEDYISSEIPSFSSSIISALREHVFPYCQYFGTFKTSNNVIIINFVSDLSVMPVDMHSGWSSPPCQFQVGISNSYGSRGGLISQSSKQLSNYYGFRLIYYNSTWSLKGVKNYTGSISNKYGDTYFGGGTLVEYSGTSSQSNTGWFDPWSLTWTKSFGYGPVWIASSSDRQYIIYSSNNTEPIIYTDDERLKLYKLWSSQYGDSLVVDLSAFRSYTPAAAYEFSDIVITLTTNGVDTDYNLPLSSSTINNGWDNNSNLYTISTPVSDFILSDTYDTYITKVSFSLDVSSPGGSGSTPYYISTNFPLDVHHSSVTPGAVPTPVYNNPTVKSDNDISQIVYYLNNTGINYSGEFLMMQGLPDIPVWANRYSETIFKMSNDSVENAGGFITEPTYNIVTGWSYNVIDIFDYFNSIIDNYDNVYDVFVFPVDYYRSYNEQLSVLYEDLGIQGYIVFFTNRYYNHQNSLNTVDILSVIQKDANNFIDFVEYLQVRLDDFENKSLEILNPIYDETTYIDDKLASILYAVNNIESYNDSSIVSLLTDIKGLLSSPANEIDTPQECIQLYEAHPDYFNELWGTPTRLSAANNQFSGSEYVRADLVPAWWEGKTLTMIYILKNDGETSRFYNDILNGLFDSYENLIESDNSFNTFIDSLFKTGYDYTDSFYGHLFDLSYDPESWDGGFAENE